MQRYFVKNIQINNNLVTILDLDHHHITKVMRMQINDRVEVCDEAENLYLCRIVNISKKDVGLEIVDKISSNTELNANITIALGLTRTSKIEEVVKRITELGASSFIPIEMNRSVVRILKDQNLKLDRLKLIVKEAAEQSKRTKLMEVYEPIKFKDLLKQIDNFDYLIYAYEEAGKTNNNQMKNMVKKFKNKNVLILVGPEGGFSLEEVNELNEHGFVAVGLGPRILRLETAPLYIMSIISYELEINL